MASSGSPWLLSTARGRMIRFYRTPHFDDICNAYVVCFFCMFFFANVMSILAHILALPELIVFNMEIIVWGSKYIKICWNGLRISWCQDTLSPRQDSLAPAAPHKVPVSRLRNVAPNTILICNCRYSIQLQVLKYFLQQDFLLYMVSFHIWISYPSIATLCQILPTVPSVRSKVLLHCVPLQIVGLPTYPPRLGCSGLHQL